MLLLVLLAAPSLVWAYSFTLTTQPTQCGPLSIKVDGGGSPPYRLLLTPIWTDAIDGIRQIVDVSFNSTTYTLNKFAFAGGSQFAATVSDQNGVGTGGTSFALNVTSSNDTSCLPSGAQPEFSLTVTPNPPQQCRPVNISWSDTVQRPVSIWGIVLGGQSFQVPLGDAAIEDSVFWVKWPVTARSGSQISFVAGDSRGLGTGGNTQLETIADGREWCLNNTSATYTGWYGTGSVRPIQTGGPEGPDPRSEPNNIPTIYGAVIGSAAGLAIGVIVVLFMRRRSQPRLTQVMPNEEFDLLRAAAAAAPTTSSSKLANGNNSPSRNVDVIQHDDGGPTSSSPSTSLGLQASEILEVPPSYDRLRGSRPRAP